MPVAERGHGTPCRPEGGNLGNGRHTAVVKRGAGRRRGSRSKITVILIADLPQARWESYGRVAALERWPDGVPGPGPSPCLAIAPLRICGYSMTFAFQPSPAARTCSMKTWKKLLLPRHATAQHRLEVGQVVDVEAQVHAEDEGHHLVVGHDARADEHEELVAPLRCRAG